MVAVSQHQGIKYLEISSQFLNIQKYTKECDILGFFGISKMQSDKFWWYSVYSKSVWVVALKCHLYRDIGC